MAANTTNVPITPGSGTNIETENVPQPGGTTGDRQRMQIGGRAGSSTTEAANDVASVLGADPSAAEFGLVVRQAGRVLPEYVNGALLTTVVALNGATATQIPGATNLVNRRRVKIINLDGTNPAYWGGSTVTASGATQGVPLGPNSETDWLPFGPGVNLFAIADTGNTPSVLILEVAE